MQRRTLSYLTSRENEGKASAEDDDDDSVPDEDEDNDPPAGPGGSVRINLDGAAGVGQVEAFIHHYKALSERQSQLAEDLHKRDEGDLQVTRTPPPPPLAQHTTSKEIRHTLVRYPCVVRHACPCGVCMWIFPS